MKEMSDSSRRAFLAAIAASGVGAAALPSVVHADSGSGSGLGFDTTSGSSAPASGSGFQPEAFPAPTPGTYYTYIQGGEFLPLANTTAYSKAQGEISTTAGGIFYASLEVVPPGARITEVTFAVVKSATYNGDSNLFIYRMGSGTYVTLDTKSTGALAQQNDEQYVSLVVSNDANWIVDNEQAATHWLVANMGANSRINSVRIGWILNRPRAFIPIDPKRVYDSRFTAPTGPLATNTDRVVSVANSFLPNSATLDVTDLVPPAAKAIAYNLTITNTLGSGFLSVAPGDAATLGASSINWFQSGMTLANGLVVKLDTNRQIKVFCGGGGSTDFIIDVLGYYV